MCDVKGCDNDGLFSPMLKEWVWEQVYTFYHADTYAKICLPCIERALERKLSRADLADCRWNADWVRKFPKPLKRPEGLLLPPGYK